MSVSRISSAVARQAARQSTAPTARTAAPLAVNQQQRNYADASTSHHSFQSPFTRGTTGHKDTTVIPSWGGYKKGGETTNKVFQYFMIGTMGGLSALGAKNTVQGMS
jgi:ubiquinol-cytochrome c reductase iron-sulfur subunit